MKKIRPLLLILLFSAGLLCPADVRPETPEKNADSRLKIEVSGSLTSFQFEEDFDLGSGWNYDATINYCTVYGPKILISFPAGFYIDISGYHGGVSVEDIAIDYKYGAGTYRLDGNGYWEFNAASGFNIAENLAVHICYFYYDLERLIRCGDNRDAEKNWMHALGLGFRTIREIGSTGISVVGLIEGYYTIDRGWKYTEGTDVQSSRSRGIGYSLENGIQYQVAGMPVYTFVGFRTRCFFTRHGNFWEMSRMFISRMTYEF